MSFEQGQNTGWTRVRYQYSAQNGHIFLRCQDSNTIIGTCILGIPQDRDVWVRGEVEHAEDLQPKMYRTYGLSSYQFGFRYVELLPLSELALDDPNVHPNSSYSQDVTGFTIKFWRHLVNTHHVRVLYAEKFDDQHFIGFRDFKGNADQCMDAVTFLALYGRDWSL